MKRTSSFLITVALIIGMVGCAPAQYGLTISSTEGGQVTTPGEDTFTYDEGTVVNLVAEAEERYHFVNWTGDVDDIANLEDATTTITMNDDYSITANFEEIPEYNLTIAATVGGNVTTPGEGTFTYDEGEVVNLVATQDAGYRFVKWTGNVGTIANVNAASTTITMNSDYSVTANFEEMPEYKLTTSGTAGGSVTVPGEGTFTYDAGTMVSLVASPAGGYLFVYWTGDVGTIANVNAATTTITMNANYSITANFEPIPPVRYNLTISSTSGGTVTAPSTGTYTYDAGTLVNLVATPAAGYRFVNWTGAVGTIANVNAVSTTITMNGDYSITANFEEDEVVTFPDPNLEQAVRQAISKPQGPVYASDLEGLTSLVAPHGHISSLTGLQHCTNLIALQLGYNQISDISPLANLTNLTDLNLEANIISNISPLTNLTSLSQLALRNNEISDISSLANLTNLTVLYLNDNQISDISPLANLTNLTYLQLYHNQISDISSLANLTNLTVLGLNYNQISDISPLANLTNLIYVYLYLNQISDISPLANLTNLTWINLWGNQISDIGPLVENEGLSEGDGVDLSGNPLSSDSINIYIPQLEARGVNVGY